MERDIAEKLNSLNIEFYEAVKEHFDSSRDYFWAGWEKLLPFVKKIDSEKLRVLDIGCGNGRFGQFLQENLDKQIEYVGIDTNDYLLEQAKERVENASLIEADLLNFDYSTLGEPFDIVAVFGVLHHIPGYINREMFFRTITSLLNPRGYFFFSNWEFLNSPSIGDRLLDWSKIELTAEDVEYDDFLMTWDRGVSAVRYCHNLTDKEIDSLISPTGLIIVDSYKSEEKGDQDNKYFVASV